MNFIASVLIAITESEEVGFLILMHLLIEKDMRAIFLPVSTHILSKIDIFARAYQSYILKTSRSHS